MITDAQREKLEALRRRFAERLPGLVAEVEALCGDLAGPDARERAVRGSHTLAGSAGTYGHLDLARAARSLELRLREGAGAEEVGTLAAALRVTLAPPGGAAVQRSA